MTVRPATLLGAVTLLDCAAILPVGVVAAYAIPLTEEFGADPGIASLLTTAFFVVGGITAASVGRLLDRLGLRRSAVGAGIVLVMISLPTLALAERRSVLVVGIAAAGAAFAVTLPATNAMLGSVVPPGRRVLAVCIKQAALPLAVLLAAGVSPWISWRYAFVLVELVAVAAVAAVVITARSVRSGSAAVGTGDVGRGLSRYGVATFLASMVVGAMLSHGALELAGVGLSDHTVAVVLLCVGFSSVCTRILSGAIVDLRGINSWWPVTVVMVVGGCGVGLLGTGRLPLVLVGCVVAYAVGWCWSGLTFARVLVENSGRPGRSTAAMQAGGMAGSAVGLIAMSWTIEHIGAGLGWSILGTGLIVAGVVVCPLTTSRS